jgi:hypothetical protein
MNYDALVRSVVALHEQTRGKAVLAVNRWLLLRNWLIGAYVVEFEQSGEDRAQYGAGLLLRSAYRPDGPHHPVISDPPIPQQDSLRYCPRTRFCGFPGLTG